MFILDDDSDPSQRASNSEDILIAWHAHDFNVPQYRIDTTADNRNQWESGVS